MINLSSISAALHMCSYILFILQYTYTHTHTHINITKASSVPIPEGGGNIKKERKKREVDKGKKNNFKIQEGNDPLSPPHTHKTQICRETPPA